MYKVKELRPLYVYDNVRFKEEGFSDFLACRLPVMIGKIPFYKFIRTFPELASEENIIESAKAFKYFDNYLIVNLENIQENDNAVMGDWIIILESATGYKIVHVQTHKEFLENYIVEDENFLQDQGIILNHKYFRIACKIPITTWHYYPNNDIDLLIDRIRKNGGKVEFHNNNRASRKLRAPATFAKSERKQTKIFDFQLAHPGEWVVVDHGGNTLIYEQYQLEEILNMENQEREALL